MSAPQSVRDSLADGETLRRMLDDFDRQDVNALGHAGGSLSRLIRLGRGSAARAKVREAARAAFRAVPALKVASPIVTVCQECGRVKGGRPVPEGARLSHGICPDCWAPTLEANGLKPRAYPGGEW